MKLILIKLIFILLFTSTFFYLYLKKSNENLQLQKKVSQYELLQKQLKIKFLDNEHLVFDKNSEINYQKSGLLVLDVFIKNFYFGDKSSKRNSLLEFFRNNTQFTVFEKGNNIVVESILFEYKETDLVSLTF